MVLKEASPDPGGGALFQSVLWPETSAYALGFGGIYVNVEGREGQGIIPRGGEYRAVCNRIAAALADLRDPKTGLRAVRRVYFRDELYHGPLASDGPDLVVGFEPGYRASWQTALGGAPQSLFDDNRKLWSGDHIVDPSCVPGVFLADRPFRRTSVRQVDVAPTVLKAFSLPKRKAMDGEAVL
jgi:predicted AlkP superfamily phosphohydrolase/phosphomutase